MRSCSIDDCERKHEAKGYCSVHYRRWKIHGDPNKLLVRKAKSGEPMRWLLEHLNFEGNECLIWPFNKDGKTGAAQISVKRSTTNPARIICEKLYGPAPSGKHHAAHSCGNGHMACVHPKHVRWATPGENEADKRIHGTIAVGENHGSSKLTEEAVRSIKISNGSCRVLGKKFGISPKQIHNIRIGKHWRHIQ